MTKEARLVFAVPLTGGMHQALHLLPVAVALHARGHAVKLWSIDEDTRRFACRLLERYGAGGLAVVPLEAGLLERLISRSRTPLKSLRLISHARQLRGIDALIVSERTTSVLRRLRLFDRPIVHIPHGAGDRAVGYEPRIAEYDFHVVAGPKDRGRFVAAGLAAPDRVADCGYIKLAGIARARLDPYRAFDNDVPVILYNPHFDERLGSFDRVGHALLDRLARRPDVNVIVAPHINYAKRLSADARAAIVARAGPNIVVDLGSARSCDMSYTGAADIYLGDVSSQVYEYASRPRPAVFIDTTGAACHDDPHFAMWGMGRVVAPDPDAIVDALDAATAEHARYREAQRDLVADSFGADWTQSPERAAEAVLAFLARHRP